jgi:hypothetical protein
MGGLGWFMFHSRGEPWSSWRPKIASANKVDPLLSVISARVDRSEVVIARGELRGDGHDWYVVLPDDCDACYSWRCYV